MSIIKSHKGRLQYHWQLTNNKYEERTERRIAGIDDILKGESKMDFTVFSKAEMAEMFQTMFAHMPEHMKNVAIKKFDGVERWKSHYMQAVASEKMQKGYAKAVEWYGIKEKFLSAAENPISKEVTESYHKRMEAILKKLIAKQDCAMNSFEVKEVVGEYGSVLKQLTQSKEEKGLMLAQAQHDRDSSMDPAGFQKTRRIFQNFQGSMDTPIPSPSNAGIKLSCAVSPSCKNPFSTPRSIA